jgi:hypothetical protein
MSTESTTAGGNRAGARHAPLTAERKATFLSELARHGIASEAARLASPHTSERHGALSTFLSERSRNLEFASLWAEAEEQANAVIEREAWRRAVEGCERGVFQKGQRVIDHDGKPATERAYSDRLLEVLLRSRLASRYGDRKQIELKGRIDVNSVTLSVNDLGLLSVAQRRELAAIMGRIAICRGEIQPDEILPVLPGTAADMIEGEML